jgi:hypothetical protein
MFRHKTTGTIFKSLRKDYGNIASFDLLNPYTIGNQVSHGGTVVDAMIVKWENIEQITPCSISDYCCPYHACLSDDCQRQIVLKNNPEGFGPGSCKVKSKK